MHRPPPLSVGLENPESDCRRDGLGAGANLELLENRRHMVIDGFCGYVQKFCQLAVGMTSHQQPENLHFP